MTYNIIWSILYGSYALIAPSIEKKPIVYRANRMLHTIIQINIRKSKTLLMLSVESSSMIMGEILSPHLIFLFDLLLTFLKSR